MRFRGCHGVMGCSSSLEKPQEVAMANVCKNAITVIGLKETSKTFVKALSKVMFQIDLDAMDPAMWGEDSSIDGKGWYTSLVDEYRQEGVYAARYGVLYPEAAYSRLGVTAPRFYCETKWKPPFDELSEASKTFPELTFHLAWCLLQDGPNGELIMKNGEVVEEERRHGSWYLFDPILNPTISLLPSHLPFTLAQRGALRVEDAIHIIEDLRGILDNKSFSESPSHPYRDSQKIEQTRQVLNGLLDQMQNAAKQLTFDDVFINDPRCKTFYDFEEKSPGGPVEDYERGADEAPTAEAVPKAVQE